VVLRSGRSPLAWFDRRAHHLVTFPDATRDVSWDGALVSLVKDDRLALGRDSQGRRWIGSLTRRPALLEMLRAAGFVDGYRGLTYRSSGPVPFA
jgi:ATP-dependent helicase Lhr and Lhr-like helicase